MTLVFSYPKNEMLAEKICEKTGFEKGRVIWRHFPDSESYIRVLSQNFDALITVDPHAHRMSLDELYTIPSTVVHAAPAIAHWLKDSGEDILLIGPDAESQQWVEPISKAIDQPFLIATKKRISDTEVVFDLPNIEPYLNRKIVIVDDIVSSGGTLIELVSRLRELHCQARSSPKVAVNFHSPTHI